MTRDSVMFMYSFFIAAIVIAMLVGLSGNAGKRNKYSLLCDEQIVSGKDNISLNNGSYAWKDGKLQGSYTPKEGEVCLVVTDNIAVGVK